MTLQLKTGVSEELIQSVGEGSREAFLSLYEQSAQAVYAYALSILHNSQDAEDAMQDTFLKVRGAAHLYRPQGKPMAWIFTIARNVCMMQLRNRQHECSGETEYDHQQMAIHP